MLEFPSEPVASLPFDLDPAPIKCWIQVKSTDKVKGNRSVKLSNWKRLVDASEPTFFLTLDFGDKKECQNAYLVHIGEEYIREVLKRLREESVKGAAKLNKLTMQFDYSADDRLDDLSGQSLKKMIEKHIPHGMDSYIKWKSNYRNSVGYENGMYLMGFGKVITPKGKEKLTFEELLVDLQLGRIPSLQFEDGEMIDTRFNIPSPQTRQEISSGEMSAISIEPIGKAVLVFEGLDYSDRVDISCENFANISPSGAYKKGEMRSRFFVIEYDFDFIPDSTRVRIQPRDFRFIAPDSNQMYTLSELSEFANLIFLLGTSTDKEDSIRLSIIHGGESKLHITNFSGLSLFREQVVYGAQIIRNAFAIAKAFDIQDKIQTNATELFALGNLLNPIYDLVMGRKFGMRFEFSVENHSSENDRFRVIEVIKFVLGNYKIVLVFSAFCDQEISWDDREGQRVCVFETNNITLEKKYRLDVQDSLPFDHDQICKEMSEKYPDDILVIVPFPR